MDELNVMERVEESKPIVELLTRIPEGRRELARVALSSFISGLMSGACGDFDARPTAHCKEARACIKT